MSVRIREQLGGFDARKRAKKIARTETTASPNAGHEAEREELIAEGLVSGKQWLTIGDSDVRAEHAALDGNVVAPRADFSVGLLRLRTLDIGACLLGSGSIAGV